MRIISGCAIIVMMSISTMSLELYKDSAPTKNTASTQDVVQSTKATVTPSSTASIRQKSLIRKVGLGIEPLVSRGDIRLNYEWLKSAQKWNYVFSGHINPHPKYKSYTGTVGLLVGGRLYSDPTMNAIFTECKAGLNIEDDEAVFVTEISAGITKEWKNDIFYEVGMGLSRSYGSVNNELTARVMLNLVIGYPYKVLGF